MTGVINLERVSVRRSEKLLLDDLSWQVKPGEHWAVLGRNGSGKTLMLRMVSGLLWPTTGTVSVLGHRFGEYDLRKLRKEIGWVSLDLQYQFQHGHQVKNVVLSGVHGTVGLHEELTSEDKEHANALLADLEVSSLAERDFGTLSYGEQKRVIIARAMIANPKLLILDEPATGLDLKSREEFLETIQSLSAGIGEGSPPTIVFVTHHIEELMPFISHALVLKDGKSVAQGSVDEVLSDQYLSEALDLPTVVTRNGDRWSLSLTS